MTDVAMRSRASPLFVLLAVAWTMSGCQKSAGTDTAANPALTSSAHERAGRAESGDGGTRSEDPHEGLHLGPAAVRKLGVVTQTLQDTQHTPEASGFGVVVAHETIAQSLADLRTAEAGARQSRAVYARGQKLAGTPGAIPLDSLEAAERQSTVDQAALDLARQRLSATYGQQAPWHGQVDHPLLKALATGEVNLVRVTLPISALGETLPSRFRLGRIGVGETAQTWNSFLLWSAPADSSVPGRSFFALLKGNRFGEGERLLAWAPMTQSKDGVVLPAAAAVIAGGRYWCYLEKSDDTFVRTEFDPSMPVSAGYFITRGAEAGDKVVIKAAGQLLATELHPSAGAE